MYGSNVFNASTSYLLPQAIRLAGSYVIPKLSRLISLTSNKVSWTVSAIVPQCVCCVKIIPLSKASSSAFLAK